jgi:hypothetical protein
MAMTFSANNYINVVGAWTNLTVATITLWVKINTFNATANRFIGSDDNWEVRATTDWGGVWRFSNELWTSTVTQPVLARRERVYGS